MMLRAVLLVLGLAGPLRAAGMSYGLDTTVAYRAPGGPWKGGFYGELGLWTPTDRPLSFGMGVGITRAEYEGPGLRKGPIMMVPLTLRSRLQFSPGPVAPYIEGGFGYYLLSHDLSEAAQRSCAAQNKTCTDRMENAFGGTLGAGLVFNFAPNASLNFFVTGLFVKANATAETVFHDTGQRTLSQKVLKLDSVVVGLKTSVRF